MNLKSKDIIRRVTFRPYRDGCGPVFRLLVWDCNEFKEPNHHRLGYRLSILEQHACDKPGKATCGTCNKSWCANCFPSPCDLCHWCNGNGPNAKRWVHRETVFEGEDFGCPRHQCVDSDATVEGIMAFLTLRPGDTDREYFSCYNKTQLDFCSQHAESLACEADRRFGRE